MASSGLRLSRPESRAPSSRNCWEKHDPQPGLDWFKSSYSDSGDVNDCVEVAWFKSSYSSSSEVTTASRSPPRPPPSSSGTPRTPTSPTSPSAPAAWAGFVASAR
ncbi:DUF397 domain-containing protein [Streptomyces cirratus]